MDQWVVSFFTDHGFSHSRRKRYISLSRLKTTTTTNCFHVHVRPLNYEHDKVSNSRQDSLSLLLKDPEEAYSLIYSHEYDRSLTCKSSHQLSIEIQEKEVVDSRYHLSAYAALL